MIKSYRDYLTYLEADRIALGQRSTIRELLFDDVWKFERLLRKYEYLLNCKKNLFRRLFTAIRLRRLERALGFSIPPNVFGPGLSIAHAGPIIVNAGAQIGSNCRIHVCVNIGASATNGSEVPVIGDNCYIGPGAKLFGNIVLGDNIAIGANAVVNKSFPEGNVSIGGIPAKVISSKGSQGTPVKTGRSSSGDRES